MKSILTSLSTRYHTIVWIRLSGELLTSLSGSMMAPFLILYLHEKLGGSIMLPMVIVGLQPLTDIVVTMFGGGVTDRLGRKPVIVLALLVQACAMAGFMFADSVWAFALLYMALGTARSFYIPAQRAQIADTVSDALRPEVMSLLSTAGYVGQTMGPLLGVLIYAYEPAYLFGIDALVIFLYTMLVWRKTGETAPLAGMEPNAGQKKQPFPQPRFSLRTALHDYRYVLLLMASALPISFFYAQTETTFRLYVQQSFPNDVAVIAGLATAKAVLAISLELWLVKKTERLPLGRIVIIAASCYAVAALGYGFAKSFALLLVAELFLVIGEAIGLTHLLNHVATVAPIDKRGRYFSLYGIHWDISRTLGPVIGGWIFMYSGGEILFVIAAVLLVGGGFLQYSLVKQKTVDTCESV
ncbi:MDR family MFS transporter [Brevibacillus fluminis]|uniref:MDR family MFS transporter n=1 Tax=Brevibacillus fluminis TaxID=511487 RepID=UPI003F894FF8